MSAAQTPSDPAEALKLGLALHQANDRAGAERLYLHVLEVCPKDPSALYLYGRFNAEADKLDLAQALFGQVAELCPDQIEGHLALAELAVRRGQSDQAIAGFRKVLTLQPDHPDALHTLASLLLQRGFAADEDFASAIAVCRAAIALLPDPAPAHAILGRILLADGRTGEAIEAYSAAVTAAPSNAAAWGGLAVALHVAGDNATALQAADGALGLNPDLVDAWFARGAALLGLQRPRDAIPAFERATALDTNQARIHLGLGDAYAELDRNREALAHLYKAVELAPSSKWAQANLGSVLYRCGDLDAAEHHCRLALAADPTLAVVHRNLAGIHADRGEDGLARFHRDTAFSLNNLIVKGAPDPKARVLILTTSDSGNVPYKHLLPADRYTRIEWFIEYAAEGQAAELPPYDLVFNIIGDLDFAGGTEAPVAAFVQTCRRPVLNDPTRIGPTRRDHLPALLSGIPDVVVPAVARLDAADAKTTDLAKWLSEVGMPLPALIRPMGSHGGRGLFLANEPADLEGVDVSEGLYATAYVDFRGAVDGLYRKYRAVFIDRVPYPYHLAIKNDWLVHYYSAEMTGDKARQAEEQRFLEDPADAIGPRGMAALAAIGARLDLDYAGVDFSILPDGQVLVFEANATMLVHPEQDPEFAYKNPHFNRISEAFQVLVDRRAAEA